MALHFRAENILDLLPACAFDCAAQLVRNSTCSSSDPTCICLDSALVAGIPACAASNCTVKQTLGATNATLTGFCGAPVRDDSMKLLIISGLFGGLALIFVLLRMLTRLSPFKAKFGLDDLFVLLATMAMIPTTVFQFFMAGAGFGRDIYTIPVDNIDRILLFFYAGETFYDFIIVVTKISILCFYLRIFTDRTFKRLVYVLMAICTAYLCAMIPPTIWQCNPIPFTWQGWSGETTGKCINVFTLTWVASSVNIALDFAVIFLPIPHLLKLTLSTKKKVQIVAMFCVGFFITIVSIVRMHSVIQFKATSNFTWDYVPIGYMSLIECDVGIICACMPAMQLLLRRVAPRLFGSTAQQTSYLHPHTSRTRTFRGTNAHLQSNNTITKTVTTTINGLSKDTDSVIELVESKKNGSIEEGSFATVSTRGPIKSDW